MPIIHSVFSPPTTPHHQDASFSVSIGGDVSISGASATGAVFRLKIGGDVSIYGRRVFIIPPPFMDEVDAGAFENQIYTARLLDETDTEILITDAVKDAPGGEIGERVSLTVGRKDLSLVTTDRRYTFQIGRWESVQDAIDNLPPEWETVCEDARLNTRSFSAARNGNQPNDSLTFDIIESNKNKLNYYPTKNYILYDPLVTEVNLDDGEKVFTSDDDYIRTVKNSFPNLTFYKVLEFARQRLGFDAIDTNVPDFPVIRADFPFNRSYAQSLAGISGMYQPIYSIRDGNVLRVQTKLAELPDDFEPQELIVDYYNQVQLQIGASTHVDGIQIVYLDSNTLADTSVDRVIQTEEETGDFGDADYTRTDIDRTYRDWFESPDLINPVRTELVREVHSTYNNALELIGRETNDYTYDAQGKRTNSSRDVESLVPDLSADGTPALLTVRNENQSVFYTTDSRNSRRQFQSKTVTQISGLIAVDAENQYFDEDFKQDLMEAHKAGNLTVDMTSEFGLLKTITETLTPLGNNQFEVRTNTTDHVRNATTNSISEPKTGDASLNAVGGKSRRYILWADGVSINARTGGEIIELAAGELPLEFAKVLGQIILDRRINGFQDGSVVIPGYHSSLQRGVFFRIYDRDGNSYGRFVCEAVQTTFNALGTIRQRVETVAQISEV